MVGLNVTHDSVVLGIPPTAQVRRGGDNRQVGVLVHADSVAAATCLRRVSRALEVAGGPAQLSGVV